MGRGLGLIILLMQRPGTHLKYDCAFLELGEGVCVGCKPNVSSSKMGQISKVTLTCSVKLNDQSRSLHNTDGQSN